MGPATAEFDKQFAQWKALLVQMRTVQEKFQIAPGSERQTLYREFTQLINQGRKMSPQLAAAAEAAFVENPDNKAVAEFLVTIALDRGRSDDYEGALRLGKLLIDHGCNNPGVYNAAGVAAVCLNEFDEARKYFKLSQDAGAAQRQCAQVFSALIDSYEPLWQKESALREAEAKADDLPRVKLEHQQGGHRR